MSKFICDGSAFCGAKKSFKDKDKKAVIAECYHCEPHDKRDCCVVNSKACGRISPRMATCVPYVESVKEENPVDVSTTPVV